MLRAKQPSRSSWTLGRNNQQMSNTGITFCRILSAPGIVLLATWLLGGLAALIRPIGPLAFILAVALWPFLVPAAGIGSLIGVFEARTEPNRKARLLWALFHAVLLGLAVITAIFAYKAARTGLAPASNG